MEVFRIIGGKPLFGDVEISGCKNGALPILFATLLLEGESILSGVPDIGDIRLSVEILRHMGARFTYLDRHTLRISTEGVTPFSVPYALTEKIRASSYLMGACLSRFGYTPQPMCGGCDLGVRPLGCHYGVFHALGALGKGDLSAAGGLVGTAYTFEKVSVGATVNGILAATGARGVTYLKNCAKEPHVVDLVRFLKRAGACIVGEGTDEITVMGGHPLHGVTYRIAPDEIEAGTYLMLGAATAGSVTVGPVTPGNLESVTGVLSAMGCHVTQGVVSLTCEGPPTQGCRVETGPHPAFPTDLHPPLAALSCFAKTPSQIRETVWEGRFRYLDPLRAMGAKVSQSGDTLTVEPSHMRGCGVEATDLRGGAALLIAALGAEGVTYLSRCQYLLRGYEAPLEKLLGIGASVTPAVG